jgi:regulator of nucleoside diphosphate kinase
VTTRPAITLSSLDLERLERLLGGLKGDAAQQAADLQAELDRAEVVKPKDIPPTLVTMNSRVRFSINGNDEQFSQTLVYPKDADSSAGRISVLAPIGSALLGLSVGDMIDWPRPDGGVSRVTIEEVLYQPEREGELHR